MTSDSNVLKNTVSDSELLMIVQGLREKTSKERVAWEERKTPAAHGVTEDGQDVRSPPRRSFQLRLPASVIELEHVRPRAEPDYIIFRLRRGSDDAVVTQRSVYEGDVGWDPLFDLYALVNRQVMGWDNVLKDVKSFLEKSPIQPVS